MNQHATLVEADRSTLTRRELLKLGGAALATAGPAGLLAPAEAPAQTPKRGGVFRIAGNADPAGFDPHQTVNWMTFISLSFTHSRLLKVKAGPGVQPGTFPLETDLAESWTQTSDTSYVFKLRKGVRWHNKPPVNGRELTAADVKYTVERFLAVKGNPWRAVFEDVLDRVEAVDRHTVRFTLKEPYAWFLDALAGQASVIVPREAVEQFGDLKKPEAVIGTGPWMLERYEPNTRIHFVRNPEYFLPGLPYADRVEIIIDPDPASRFAAWLAGRYDFAPEFNMVVRRIDLDVARRQKSTLQTAEYIWLVGVVAAMKIEQEPFRDIRVRRALARAMNWREMLEVTPFGQGQGAVSPAVPAALTEWAIPIDQLPPEGRRLYEFDIGEAKRLLAEAGHPKGLKVALDTTAGFGPDYMDIVQVVLRNWKAAGIETELRLKELGAFLSSTVFGKFDQLLIALRGALLYPDPYLVNQVLPGKPFNVAPVNDPKVVEMIRLSQRTFDPAKRREIIFDIQRYLSERVYYLYSISSRAVSAWEPYVRNFGPNLGNDYGGRLMAAWLDR